MIATVLAQPARGAAEDVARWRQLVDLLAQRRGAGAGDSAERAFAWLEEHRAEVGLLVRQQAAQTLAWRRIEPRLLRFFADDHPSVAQPLVSTCRLDAAEWLALLPLLNPTARGLLRHRRDLPADVEQALEAFGKTDFQLGSPEGAGSPAAAPGLSPGAEKGDAQIRELVARIEAYRRQKEAAGAELQHEAPPEAEPADGFRWECGPDGIIIWVHGAPRGPLVGQSIASIAERGQFGVDGQAAGAFEKRSPFRDARFSVAGEGAAAGDWRISGVPFFEPHRGHFLGYRGSARRPRLDEVARSAGEAQGDGVFGTRLPADSLRQLIHELRTPLNAILGFAEMIDGQYMGPAADQYRTRAADIVEQARRLLTAVDDLDTAARIETSRLDLGGADAASVDAVALLCRLHDSYERVAGQRRATIAIEIARNLPPARVEPAAAERMFSRLLAATVGLAREGETIGASMRVAGHGGERMLCLSIDRPRAIDGLEERALLDPGYSPDGDWPAAPVLGLGFSLRLVRNLAEAVGGGLQVGETRFNLYLPPLEGSSGRGEQGEGAGG